MQVKSTLRVIDQANVKPRGGVTDGQTLKPIVGFADTPTDRIRISVATYEPGTLEPLHWHPIKRSTNIISGHAVVRNIEGEEFHVGGGTGIYAPAGIAGAHEWEVKESLQLVSIRATASVRPQDAVHLGSTRRRSARTFISRNWRTAAVCLSSRTTDERRGLHRV